MHNKLRVCVICDYTTRYVLVCIGCFPILPYILKEIRFQFQLTSTNIKVKITTKINSYQKCDVI